MKALLCAILALMMLATLASAQQYFYNPTTGEYYEELCTGNQYGRVNCRTKPMTCEKVLALGYDLTFGCVNYLERNGYSISRGGQQLRGQIDPLAQAIGIIGGFLLLNELNNHQRHRK
jgi:hypothetical protein